MKRLAWLLVWLLIGSTCWGQTDSVRLDSLPLVGVTADTSGTDSVQVDPVAEARKKRQEEMKQRSDFMNKLTAEGRDSSVFDVKNDRLYLYGAPVTVQYEEITIKAPIVWIDFSIQTLHAEMLPDSLRPAEPMYAQFSDGRDDYEAEEMIYNFKTEKGIIRRGRTTYEDGRILAERVKKQDDGSLHARSARFTTCDLDHPHYYIESRKAKIIPNKQFISGPLNLVIEDFPLPVVVPFGFFPTNQNKRQRSGILIPQPGESPQTGFFLRGLGYYWAINDYVDLKVDGDIFSTGGYRLGLRTNYNVRYRFNGGFSFNYAVQRFGECRSDFCDPDFNKTGGFQLTWRHSQPINPTTNFSANVNIGNQRYLQRISLDPDDFLNNTLASSVNFTKRFDPFTLNVTGSQRQDLNRRTIDVTLPTVTLTMNRQQPFSRVRGEGLEWLRQLGINYGAQATNQLSAPDSLFGDILLNPGGEIPVLDEDSVLRAEPVGNYYRRGMVQNFDLSTSARLFNFVNFNASADYNEYWVLETIQRSYNRTEDKIEEFLRPGFATARDFSFRAGPNATFFGFYGLKNKRETTVRQQMNASLSYNYNPDFGDSTFGYYGTVQRNRSGETELYDRFSRNPFGSPNVGERQAVSFNLNNVFEMKYRTQESFAPDFDENKDPFERVRLLDALSVGSSYNFAADSFRLAPFRTNVRTTLFDRKLTVNGAATFDPYVLERTDLEIPLEEDPGRRVDRFFWQVPGQAPRLTGAQLSLVTRFSAKPSRRKTASEGFDTLEYRQVRANLDQYVDFDVPWSVSLNYSINYRRNTLQPGTINTHTLRVNGDFSLTPKWKVTYQTGLNLNELEPTYTTFSVIRDLHCWELAFNTSPFGERRFYLLTINVRSSTLKDLRLTKQSRFQDRSFL